VIATLTEQIDRGVYELGPTLFNESGHIHFASDMRKCVIFRLGHGAKKDTKILIVYSSAI
jgi:hypothetical protein